MYSKLRGRASLRAANGRIATPTILLSLFFGTLPSVAAIAHAQEVAAERAPHLPHMLSI